MNWLSKFISGLFGRKPTPIAPQPPVASPAASAPEPPLALATQIVSTAPPVVAYEPVVEIFEDEDNLEAEEVEEDEAETDPTIGRYERLHVPVLNPMEIKSQRADAELLAMAGPNKVFPHDPAGPGSLAETLARLEAEGRVVSRVCDDTDGGFYVLYEPKPPAEA